MFNNKTGGEIIVKKVEVVLQDGIHDCGVCSLLSIIRFYGGNVSKEYLLELTSTTKNGVSAYHLIKAATMLGFSAIGVEGKIEELSKDDLPCIAHVIINKSYQHFLVLYDIDQKQKKILIMDPAKGKKTVPISEFKLMSSNKYILLRPNKQLPNMTVKKIISILFLNKVKKEYIPVLIILSLSILITVLNILTAYHFKYLMEYAITLQSIENAMAISLFVLALYLIKEMANHLRDITLLKWSNTFDFHLTNKVLEQIISFPYLYYKNRTTGEILARMKDLGVVKNFIITLLCMMIPELVSFCTFLLLLWNLNRTLATYSIIFFFVLLILQLIFKAPIKKRMKKYRRKEERLNSFLIELISGYDAVKGLHMEEVMMKKWKEKYYSLLKLHTSLMQLSYLEKLLKNSSHHIMMVLLLLIGSKAVIAGSFSISELIIFQSMLAYTTSSFSNLLDFFKSKQEVQISKERIEDLFTIHKESFSMSHYFSLQNLEGKIEIKNLSYSYNRLPLLKEINITIPYGKHVFIYGESGSGKSTLAKMLLQYIKVPYGTISIANIDINHYHLATLRTKITYISQQEHLFCDTILKNIVMDRSLADEKVEMLIKKLYLEEVINKNPLGIHQILEENGVNLSGGERQRIILARSILKNSDIYILDEATSQIDIEKERAILKNIFSILKGKTIIVISHRFDNKDLFNQVVHLEKGKCYEEKIK